MKILIIGATGFIGTHLVELLKDEHELCLFHRGNCKDPIFEGMKHIIGERKNLHLYANLFTKRKPELIIDLIPYFAQDAWDVVNCFRGISDRIIALSSGDVYRAYEIFKDNLPEIEEGELKEASRLRQQLFPYRGMDASNYLLEHYEKILVEQILMNNTETDTTLLRLGAIYGEGDKQHKLQEYLRPMLDNHQEIILSQSKANWRWTRAYVKDVAAGIKLCIESEASRNEIFNLGNPIAETQLELIKKLQELSGWQGDVVLQGTDETSKNNYNYAQHLILNTDKIRKTLNYTESYTYEEGLLNAIAYERRPDRGETEHRDQNWSA